MSSSNNATKFYPAFSLEEGLRFLVHKDGQDFCLEGETLVIRRSNEPSDYSALPLHVVKRFYPKFSELVTLCLNRLDTKEELECIAEDLESHPPDFHRRSRWLRKQKRWQRWLYEGEEEVRKLNIG
jgi:hypothetical protein